MRNVQITVYGIAALLPAFAQEVSAPTFTTLFNFGGANGANPQASLVQGTDGSLYGTTSSGGINNGGIVFKLTSGVTFMILQDFVDFGDGRYPNGLVLHSNGTLYGTTSSGGVSGAGTIFGIEPTDKYASLFSFPASGSIGTNPEAALIEGANGLLYGTAEMGGLGSGTIFRATPAGTASPLYEFNGSTGKLPLSSLVQASNGALYGTADQGGNFNAGTIFRITPGGAFTLLDDLGQGPSGANPQGALVQTTGGAIYGTTAVGGTNGLGTVFRMTPQGVVTPLVNFNGTGKHGWNPTAGLIQASDGNLYGVTHNGGGNGGGTIFKMTPSGFVTFLWSLPANAQPSAALFQATDGKLYGTTLSDGSFGFGTVFSLDLGFAPFVRSLPAAAKLGSAVQILGTNLSGATAVTFNGVAAAYSVISPTLIESAVPLNAVTGFVQVTLPGGTLTSDVPFRVL